MSDRDKAFRERLAALEITPEMAQECASRLIAGAFRRDDKRPRFSIPTRHDDDDIVIVEFIKRAGADLAAEREAHAETRKQLDAAHKALGAVSAGNGRMALENVGLAARLRTSESRHAALAEEARKALEAIDSWQNARAKLCAHYVSGSKEPAINMWAALGEAEDCLRKISVDAASLRQALDGKGQ